MLEEGNNMKRFVILSLLATCAAANAQWAPGNLVVAIVGDGTTALSGQIAFPLTLRQYSPAGVQVGADVALPTAASGIMRALTTQSDETSEAGLQLSADGRYVLTQGYNAAPFTAAPGLVSDRTFARIPSFLAADTVSGGPYAQFGGDSVRTLYSMDGNNFWVSSGSAGIDYVAYGGKSAAVQIVDDWSSARYLTAFNGDLYYTSSDDNLGLSNTVYRIPGMPTTGPVNPIVDIAQNPSPRAMVFVGPDLLYLATSTGSAGLIKYQLISGVWTELYRSGPATGGINGLAKVGSNLYATRSNGSELLEIVDTGTGFTASTIAVAPANTIFRGLVPTPSATVPVSGQITLENWTGVVAGRLVTFELASSTDGIILETTVAAVDGSGNFTIATAQAPGNYVLYAKASHWLRKATVFALGGGGAAGVNASLINGDVDGDNEVSIGDYAVLSAAFGSGPGDPNWEEEADLDGDDEVSIGDYAILSANFGLAGD